MPPYKHSLIALALSTIFATGAVLARQETPVPASSTTAPTPAEDPAAASPTPPEAPAEQPAAGGKGHIVFYRPSAFFGAGMRSDINLDGNRVGESHTGHRFSVEVPAGTHHIAVPNSVYSGERTLDVDVADGETVYVRTWIGGSGFGGRTNVQKVDSEQGAKESQGLKEEKR